MRVVPSLTLKPVSLKVNTGALRMTAPVAGGGCMFPMLDMADASGLPPEPPQAIKKAVVATITREREKKSRGKNAVNFFTMSN
jgi:hypothetical protein